MSMYKIKVSKVVNIFNKILKLTHNSLLEISIKKSRVNFEFKESNLIHIRDIIDLLTDEFIDEDYLYLTALGDNIHLTYECGDKVMHNDIPVNSLFKDLFDLLEEVGEHICQCPALEYVISENYIKVFIDKPNIESNDLYNLKQVFGQEFTLELQKQRPYCLFLNLTDKVDFNQITFDDINYTEDVKESLKPQILTSDMVRKI